MILAHDPLQFEHQRLENGISVRHRHHQVDFLELTIRFPIGSGHNQGSILPGSFHFLEHGLFLGSKAYPQAHQYQQAVEDAGGTLNGTIYAEYTDYSLSLPTIELEGLLPGFFSMLFEPLFTESELERERAVVITERKRSERWYPSENEVSHYLYTKWCWTAPLELRTRLGFDQDLAQMDSQYLHQLHARYFTQGIEVMSVGGVAPTVFWDMLATLALPQPKVEPTLLSPHWIDRSFREVAFRDLSRPEYFMEGLVVQKPDRLQYRAFSSGLDYLFNNGVGVIYRWLRDELGRVYDISYGSVREFGYLSWNIRVPMSEVSHIYELKEQLPEKIEQALSNDAAIAQYIERILKTSCYWYQTVDEILEEGLLQLELFGTVYPLQNLVELLEEAARPGQVAAAWRTFVTNQPNTIGDLILLPKEE